MARKPKIKIQTETVEIPRPRRYTPRPCSMCESVRPAGVSYSRVYGRAGSIRYVRCDFCNNTWCEQSVSIGEKKE